MSDDKKAEAKEEEAKQPEQASKAVAETRETPEQKQGQLITRRFGEFIPKGVDPLSIYRKWKGSIFADPEKADDETMFFVLSQAKAMGIDPTVPGQIYALPFNTKDQKTGQYVIKHTIVVGIEGMVTRAESTGQYGGTTEPVYEFEGTKEEGKPSKPVSCSIGVQKIVQGVLVTSEQKVYFDEYYKPGKNGYPSMWDSKPKTMIKKVALAHALRATFGACKGLNIAEEFDRNDVISVDSEGNVIETMGTAEIQKKVKECTNLNVLQKFFEGLSPEDKAKAQPFVEKRFSEIGDK